MCGVGGVLSDHHARTPVNCRRRLLSLQRNRLPTGAEIRTKRLTDIFVLCSQREPAKPTLDPAGACALLSARESPRPPADTINESSERATLVMSSTYNVEGEVNLGWGGEQVVRLKSSPDGLYGGLVRSLSPLPSRFDSGLSAATKKVFARLCKNNPYIGFFHYSPR